MWSKPVALSEDRNKHFRRPACSQCSALWAAVNMQADWSLMCFKVWLSRSQVAFVRGLKTPVSIWTCTNLTRPKLPLSGISSSIWPGPWVEWGEVILRVMCALQVLTGGSPSSPCLEPPSALLVAQVSHVIRTSKAVLSLSSVELREAVVQELMYILRPVHCGEKCHSCFCVFVLGSVQSYPTLRPRGLQHARPPCPSPTPRVYSDSCPLSWWCHPTISSSVFPFSSCL